MPGSRFHKPYPPRANIGERHGMAKLTEADVRAIRARHVWRCPINGSKALAREFKVSRGTVEFILRGETWKHISAEAA